ncbi:MAG: SigB/SigF/SigG family RNA polymerase sigma factor [Actinobacteria bacterium]|nr:SigB/SigF/SigG family RNA polymerase sigma factor [Actinomycetota bacterium]
MPVQPRKDPALKADTSTAPSRARRDRGWGDEQRRVERECLEAMADPQVDDGARERATHQLVLLHAGLVEHIARKFRDRGEPLEDLTQVGMLGLLKAAQRFDLTREVEFSTYATITVTGEIKRHFRDRTWAVHMPRQLQELRMSVSRAYEELSHQLGRPPSVADLAEHLALPECDVVDGQRSALAYAAVSLEALAERRDGGEIDLGEFAAEDPDIHLVELRRTLVPAVQRLPQREFTIITMHFFHGCSQSTIAAHLGISQMHVSRLLARALEKLRLAIDDRPASGPPSTPGEPGRRL